MMTENSSYPVRTLLVVDDEPDLREILQSSVEALGYACISAGGSLEALNIVDRVKPIHAVLCDINMPVMTGIELLAQLRAKGQDIPFVFLTGFGCEAHLLKAVQLGAFDFMQKPFNPEDLSNIVSRVLEAGTRRSAVRERMESLEYQYPALADELREISRNQQQLERLHAAAALKKPA